MSIDCRLEARSTGFAAASFTSLDDKEIER